MVQLAVNDRKAVPAVFYQSQGGKEPVRDWLLELSKDDRKSVGKDIKTVEFGWPIGMPTCCPMGGGLYEVRTDLTDKRIARVLFCFHDGEMVLLNSFIKKSQKTPKPEVELAQKRKKEP
jgi:phage-related protein